MYLLIGVLVLRAIGSAILGFLACSLRLRYEIAASTDRTNGQIAGDLFRAGLSIGGVNILGIIQNRLDRLLVSGMISTLALASYSGNKIYEVLQLVISVSLRTIYPWLCNDKENERYTLLLHARLVIVAGALLGFGGMFISPVLINLIFQGKYSGAGLPLTILMLSASLIATSGVFYHLSLSKGLESRVFLISGLVDGAVIHSLPL